MFKTLGLWQNREEKVEVVEIDELHAFIERKKQSAHRNIRGPRDPVYTWLGV